MLLIPDPTTAVVDPFRQHTTLNINAFVRDPVTGESYSRDPRYIAQKAEAYLRLDRHRRHRVLRPRSRVLHLRLGALRPEPVLGLLLPRLGRGRVELRPRTRARRRAEPRVQAAVQGGLLPGTADGPVPGPAFRDGARARAGRHHDRGAAPRGRYRGSGRDRHALRQARGDGRQADALQVRREERGARRGLLRDVHAEAALHGQRFGHARAPVAVEGRRADSSSTRRATPACRTTRAGTSAAC